MFLQFLIVFFSFLVFVPSFSTAQENPQEEVNRLKQELTTLQAQHKICEDDRAQTKGQFRAAEQRFKEQLSQCQCPPEKPAS